MAIRKELTFQSADEVTTIHGYVWEPERGQAKAVIQLCHGMVEFIDRYEPLANALCEQGYVVYGADTLGHGKSVLNTKCYGYFGDKNGNWKLLSDMVTLHDLARRDYPGIPYYIVGHSFGSLMVREFVQRFPDFADGMILIGIVNPNIAVSEMGRILCEIVAHVQKDGYRYRSTLINDMAIGSYDKPFKDENLRNSWISKDRENIMYYNGRPECNFIFTVGAYRVMMTAFSEVNKQKNLDRMRREMPVLLMAGTDDAAGDFGKAPKALYQVYKNRGMDCRLRMYKGCRHEILNDIKKEQVIHDMIKWLDYYTENKQ